MSTEIFKIAFLRRLKFFKMLSPLCEVYLFNFYLGKIIKTT